MTRLPSALLKRLESSMLATDSARNVADHCARTAGLSMFRESVCQLTAHGESKEKTGTDCHSNAA